MKILLDHLLHGRIGNHIQLYNPSLSLLSRKHNDSFLPFHFSFTYTITTVRFHLCLPNKVQQLVITKITKISNVEIPGILIACL